jgi:hypothetical protein
MLNRIIELVQCINSTLLDRKNNKKIDELELVEQEVNDITDIVSVFEYYYEATLALSQNFQN